jgi:hypothetical protein
VTISEYTNGSVNYERVNLRSVDVAGFSPSWVEVNGGEILQGRNFSDLEYAAGAHVCIINDKLAQELFPGLDPIGKRIRIFGELFEVVGLHAEAANLFSNASSPRLAMPHTTFTKVAEYLKGWMDIAVIPTERRRAGGHGRLSPPSASALPRQRTIQVEFGPVSDFQPDTRFSSSCWHCPA